MANDEFIRKCARMTPSMRLDGRSSTEFREVRILPGPLNGQTSVYIGSTLVRTTVVGQIVQPLMDRPNEGRIFFNAEILDIQESGLSDATRSPCDVTSICNYTERVLRGCKAVDTESLCILGGKSAWSIRVDMHVVSMDGSLLDACSLGALTALLNFRHEAVMIEGGDATVFSAHCREPVHLPLHHLPISTTFVAFDSDESSRWLADPCKEEEISLDSSFTIACNQHGELCGIHKPGGFPIPQERLTECIDLAVHRAKYVAEVVRKCSGRLIE